MILGRPANMWAAAVTALLNCLFLGLSSVGDVVPDSLVAAVNIAAAAIIALIAIQPPTLKVGDPYVVQTPAGEPSVTKQANTNTTAIPPTDSHVTTPTP